MGAHRQTEAGQPMHGVVPMPLGRREGGGRGMSRGALGPRFKVEFGVAAALGPDRE